MIRRSVNWKFLLITLLICSAAAPLLYGLHAWQISRTSHVLLSMADVHDGRSDWTKSAEYLDRYLRLKNDDAPVRVRLALTYGHIAGMPEALPHQKTRATELHYRALATGLTDKELELRRGLASLLLETGRFAAAEKEAHRVLDAAGAEDPQGQQVLALALVAQLAEGSLAGTKTEELGLVRTVMRARQLNPDHERLASILAMLYREFPQVVLAEYPTLTEPERQQRANESLDLLVRENPTSAAAFLARQVYRMRYGIADAAADLETALQLAPNDSEVQYAVAKNAYDQALAAQKNGNPLEATKYFEQALSYYEKLLSKPIKLHRPEYYSGQGNAWLGLKNIDKALAAWREGIHTFRKLTTQISFYSSIADACLDHGRLGEAGETLDKIDEILNNLGNSARRDEKVKLTWAQDLRRATWYIKRQEFAQAVLLLRKVVSQTKGEADSQPTFGALLKLGSVYSMLGTWREAANAYDQATGLLPNFSPCHIAAANAWLSGGRADFAVERAEHALKISSTVEAWLVLAVAQFQLQLSVPAEDRSWTRFQQALEVLEKTSDEMRGAIPWQIDFLRADYLVARAKSTNDSSSGFAEAAKHLQQCESKYASHKEFWRDLSLAYQRLKRNADSDRSLDEFRRVGGEAVDVVVIQSRQASLRGDDERAKALLSQALLTMPSDPEKLRSELLRLMLATKDLEAARTMLRQNQERRPHNVATLRQLAELNMELRDFKEAAIWESKLQAEGAIGEQLARYYRAWRLMQSATRADAPELRDALHELELVVMAHPDWSEASSLKGMVEDRLGRSELAAADYERAVQFGERRLIVFERLVDLLDQLHRPADIERLLARLEEDINLSQRLVELVTDREIRRDRPERALAVARRNAEQRPTDPAAQLWLGRLLLVTNHEEEAEQVVRRTVEMNPADSRVWNAMFSLYARTSNQEGLAKFVEQLQANSALDAAQKSLLLAEANVVLGNLEEAKRRFVEAAQAGPNDLATQLRAAQFYMRNDSEQARGYLQAALRLDPKSSAAKRMLAILDASQKNLTTAERLLHDTDETAGASSASEDTRLHAALLIQRGGAVNLEQAIALLKDIVARNSPSPAINHLLLAQAYEQLALSHDNPDGREAGLQSARQELTVLAERPEPEPAHLGKLVNFLIRHQRLDEATLWLTKLENRVSSLSKNDPNAVTIVIQALIQRGSFNDLEKWLKKLEEIDSDALRPTILRVQAAIAQDANADISGLVEPKAASLVAAAKTSADKKQVYNRLADLYASFKKYAAAERWYRLLVAEDPTQIAALVGVLVPQGNLQGAIESCEEAAKRDDTPRPALVLAKALIDGHGQSADVRRAEPIFAAALKKSDSNVNLLYALGVLKLIEDKNAESIELFRRIVKINPRFVPALNNLAMVLADTPAHQAEALQFIDQALEIAGRETELLDTKGAILVYSGRSSEAVPLLEAATQDAKADARHHFHLAAAYRDVGKIEEAKQQLKTALDRQLSSLALTSTDQKLLTALRTALQL